MVMACDRTMDMFDRVQCEPSVLDAPGVRVLRLSLNKTPFEVMVTGEKREEFRKVCRWIESRLFNKDGSKREYDYIEYVNGYGSDRPRFVTDFKGFELVDGGIHRKYSNGLELNITETQYVIQHSKVLEVKNVTDLKQKSLNKKWKGNGNYKIRNI